MEAIAVQNSSRTKLICAYGIEGLTSVTVNLVMNGIAFYMSSAYHWSAGSRLLLMTVQGMAYAIGALSAGKFAGMFSRRKTMVGCQLTLVALLAGVAFAVSPWVLIPLLLAASMVSTVTWPLAESLITEDCDAAHMSRRITIYNLTWSITGAAVIAAYGTIIYYWPRGPMVIPVFVQMVSLTLAFVLLRTQGASGANAVHHHDEVPEELLADRRLALWLSRISLPASFVLANTLMGVFSSLPASVEMGERLRTVVASLWMIGRVAMFMLLGTTAWWHTRPRLLFWAALAMLVAFAAIILPAQRVGPFATCPLAVVIALMTAGELLLGLMAGYIFSGSLYFGMVLSKGSTEQGGYHEALIGVGMVMGPGLAAAAQQFATNDSNWPALAAVGAMLVVTLGGAGWVMLKARDSSVVQAEELCQGVDVGV